jgi:adenylosuccinate synthase
MFCHLPKAHLMNTILVGAQWGDEAVSDHRCPDRTGDIVVRTQGGNNADTPYLKIPEYALHLIPSGTLLARRSA